MTPIKMFVTIRSKPHLSKQQFHDHWRHPHGTWGRGIRNLTSYVQSHRIDTPHLGAAQAELDGVVEVGLETAEDVAGLSTDKAYIEHLQTDEPNFVENIGLSFMNEDVLRSGERPTEGQDDGRWPWRESEQPVSIKLIQVITNVGGEPWKPDDEKAIGQALAATRHVIATPDRTLHPTDEMNAIVAIRQLWWPTYTAFETGISQSQTAWQELTAQAAGRYSGIFQAERFF
ncbi:EthD domain-containing protein [Pseudochelatococcus sp. B33]